LTENGIHIIVEFFTVYYFIKNRSLEHNAALAKKNLDYTIRARVEHYVFCFSIRLKRSSMAECLQGKQRMISPISRKITYFTIYTFISVFQYCYATSLAELRIML